MIWRVMVPGSSIWCAATAFSPSGYLRETRKARLLKEEWPDYVQARRARQQAETAWQAYRSAKKTADTLREHLRGQENDAFLAAVRAKRENRRQSGKPSLGGLPEPIWRRSDDS